MNTGIRINSYSCYTYPRNQNYTFKRYKDEKETTNITKTATTVTIKLFKNWKKPLL